MAKPVKLTVSWAYSGTINITEQILGGVRREQDEGLRNNEELGA